MRLIDADKLNDEVLKWLPSNPCGVEEREFPYETDIVVSMLQTLDEAPSIEIIRCRECKAYDSEHEWCGGLGLEMKPDDFCSYGRRKE